jgi:RNA polymerase sigma-70 factor (ECF subfamily)
MPPERQVARSRHAALGDSELALLARGGDDEAFGELVQRSAPAVQGLLRRLGAQAAVADDLMQDALVAALRSIHHFRGDAPFAYWVGRIAARLYMKRCRKEARYQWSAEPLDPETAADSGATIGDRIDLDRALEQLSYTERLCVSLCHGAGLSHVEIAEGVGIPLGTVKSHISRGLRKLKKHMLGAAAGEDP